MAPWRDVPGPEEEIDHASDLIVRETVGLLTPRQYRVVVLRYTHGLSIREIARQEGIAAGTVRDALARAHARLRRALGPG